MIALVFVALLVLLSVVSVTRLTADSRNPDYDLGLVTGRRARRSVAR
jgi:hypothetical protein